MYPKALDKYCKLVWVPSFVMEMAINVGPDQTAPLRMPFDQDLQIPMLQELSLTVMDGSLPNFTFNFRFYSFIHTDKLDY